MTHIAMSRRGTQVLRKFLNCTARPGFVTIINDDLTGATATCEGTGLAPTNDLESWYNNVEPRIGDGLSGM